MGKNKKMNIKKVIKEYLFICYGVILVALSFSFFLNPYNLVIGGVSGIAIILKPYLNVALAIFIINALLLILGWIFLGRQFFIKTIFGSITFPLFVYVFEEIYNFLKNANNGNNLIPETNMLLITIFGAILMGLGLGITVKHGGSTGGTEIPQNIAYKYWKIPYSLSLLIFDGSIVLIGFFLIKDDEGLLKYDFLLYAILFIYISGLVMDQIVFRGFNKRAVFIISKANEVIKQRILNDFGRGVTEVRVIGGYTGENRTKLVCILSTSQFYKLKAIINEIDPQAFYYVVRASEVGGEGFTYDEM